jgi:hypothetical protein
MKYTNWRAIVFPKTRDVWRFAGADVAALLQKGNRP